MIPPSERYPPAASPHVCRNNDPLRFTAAHGPIFSKIRTGTTRYVTMPHAAPSAPAIIRPRKPNRSAIARKMRPIVAVTKAHPAMRRTFALATFSPSEIVGSPPFNRIMAAPMTAALK